jgi:hypothetical protein
MSVIQTIDLTKSLANDPRLDPNSSFGSKGLKPTPETSVPGTM